VKPTGPQAGEAAVAYVGLGANLGEAPRTLSAAFEALSALPRTQLLARSSLYRSAPVDAQGPDFYNAVAKLSTQLEPLALLDALQAIENQHGRERPYVNAPRTLDLDLLLYGEQQMTSAHLTLPHPRMLERAFVLLPLYELSPMLELPGGGSLSEGLRQTVAQRVERLQGGFRHPA
jgi:2-amino-4-hydroxy-6-hydroxymethyldihydropteridine diphosphokinase